MRSQQRYLLFFLLATLILVGGPIVLERLGIVTPPRAAKPDPVAAKDEEKNEPDDPVAKAKDVPATKDQSAKAEAGKPGEDKKEVAKAAPKDKADKPAPAKPRIALADPSELILGSLTEKTNQGYQIQMQLNQKGAGVASIASSRFDAEFKDGRPSKRPLQIIEPDPSAPPSFCLIWISPEKSDALAPAVPDASEDESDDSSTTLERDQISMDYQVWEVVRDPNRAAVRKIEKSDPSTKKIVDGQEIAFRTHVQELGVDLTKTFRLWKGENGFEFDLAVTGGDKAQSIVYRLMGPHGIPIEGEWYTQTFRDVCFGQVKGNKISVVNKTAAEVVKGTDNRQTVPLKFAGVEDQYFAVLIEPKFEKQDERWDAETEAMVIHERAPDTHKADVSVSILTKPFSVGAGKEVVHSYQVFAGPKTAAALAPYHAVDLATSRKSWSFGGTATFMATQIITPLLTRIYHFTSYVAHMFGGKRGNYGVAIILLTITVRLLLFPLGRKQAMTAKKMQDLQPHLQALKAKYGDDKERITKETFALYREYKVNPMAGCLPALIQLPIFTGLWQALNNNVALRHAPFLPFFIRDLSAPDMLFHLPFSIPFLGEYFNLLPFVVMGLMMVQTKLFAPPAANAEAEMQQKMMKYMMIFMAFMFYKVPSGLGLYFITSSLWGIGERLLLPKLAAATAKPIVLTEGEGSPDPDGGSGPGGGNGRGQRPGGNGQKGSGGGFGGGGGWLSQKFQQILEEAAKDATIRNDKDDNRDRPRQKTRSGRRD